MAPTPDLEARVGMKGSPIGLRRRDKVHYRDDAALVSAAPPGVPAIVDAPVDRLQDALASLMSALGSEESRRAYRGDWTQHVAFLAEGGVHPLAARPRHVAAHLEDMRRRKLARATRARTLSVVREVYGAFCRADLRADNPAREIKLPKAGEDLRTPWLGEEGLTLLLRPFGDSWLARRDRLVLLCLAGLGWRRAETARFHRDQLFRAGTGRLAAHARGKAGRQSDVLIPEWLEHEIGQWIAHAGITGWMFPRLDRGQSEPDLDRPISGAQVYEICHDAARSTGLDPRRVTPHAIRRSFVTIARQHGVSIEGVQAAVLHRHVSTTERYDKALRGLQRAPGDKLRDIYEASNAHSREHETGS